MMRLDFSAQRLAPRFDPDSPTVEVWRDNEGRECAYGQTVAGEDWMHIPQVGSFCFPHLDSVARNDGGRAAGRAAGRTVEDTVEVVPIAGVSRDVIVDTYYRTVLPMALQTRGKEVLHASAVKTPKGVLSLCAVSETGKSTLAYGLQRRGHDLYADDAVVFELLNGAPRLTQIPFTIRLRKPSAALFGEQSRETVRVEGEAVRAPESLPLAAICILERMPEQAGPPVKAARRDRAVEVDSLAPAAAFAAVLPHAYCFSFASERRKKLMMQQYLALVASVPVLRVRFRTGLEHLPEILDELEGQLAVLGPMSERGQRAADPHVLEKVT